MAVNGINKFFEFELAAPLYNPRWSWGALNESTNTVFLRVWKDQIIEQEGEAWVRVFWTNVDKSRPGLGERKQQIQLLSDGATGYGIVCEAKSTQGKRREIKSFDRDIALLLGSLRQDADGILARVDRRVPIALITGAASNASLAEDVRSVYLDNQISKTTREALIDARLGQGRFRAEVLSKWNQCCAVTGIQLLQLIRASHIKPWRYSNNEERLDVENGLPLVANLDALFDARLISFSDEGEIIISPRLTEKSSRMLGLEGMRLTRRPGQRMQRFLSHHRKMFVRAAEDRLLKA